MDTGKRPIEEESGGTIKRPKLPENTLPSTDQRPSNDSFQNEIDAINSDDGTFLTVDPALFEDGTLKTYTPEERDGFSVAMTNKFTNTGKLIKSYFSWPFDFPTVIRPTGPIAPPTGNTNNTIQSRRKIYPVFSKNSGPDECSDYLEALRDKVAADIESAFEVANESVKDKFYNRELKLNVDNPPIRNVSERALSTLFYIVIVFPCMRLLSLFFGCISDDPMSESSNAQISDIVPCSNTYPFQPLLIVEMKHRHLSAFLNEDGSIKKIPMSKEESEEIDENTGRPTGKTRPGYADWGTAKKFIKLINQAYNYMIKYGKKWCLVSDFETTLYIVVDTESQEWKDMAATFKSCEEKDKEGEQGDGETEEEEDLSSEFVEVPFKCRVIKIADTKLTLQTIFISLLHDANERARKGLDDDDPDSDTNVSQILERLVRFKPQEFNKRFPNVTPFTSSLKGAFDHTKKSQGPGDGIEDLSHDYGLSSMPKHFGNVESVEFTPLQHGSEYLSQVLLFDASKLKQYLPTLNIPASGKVVMKLYDEQLIQAYASSEHDDEEMSWSECFGAAGVRFVREIASYQRISSAQVNINTPLLHDFGQIVLLEKSSLKFSGLFMIMSHIEPEPTETMNRNALDRATNSFEMLNKIGIDHNDIKDGNTVLSNGEVFILDFSHANLTDFHLQDIAGLVDNWDRDINDQTLVGTLTSKFSSSSSRDTDSLASMVSQLFLP